MSAAMAATRVLAVVLAPPLLELSFASLLFAKHVLGQPGRLARHGPWAHRDADPTAVALCKIREATIEVDGPFRDASHQSLVRRDRVGRAGVGAHSTAQAEVVDAERVAR